jgi:membrane protein
VHEVIQRQGGLLTFGILATLWCASGGSRRCASGSTAPTVSPPSAPSVALPAEYGPVIGGLGSSSRRSGDPRSRGLAVLGPGADRLLEARLAFGTARYVTAAVLLLGSLLLLHRWLPNARQPLANTVPGVCATTALWLLVAALFSWYVGHLADYSVFYGSLGGVAITLIFFYVNALLFIFGAEINAVWREDTSRARVGNDI